MRLVAVTLALGLTLAACSRVETPYFRVEITEADWRSPSFGEEAIISLWALYAEGFCGDQYPILEDQTIYTPSCGLSQTALHARFSRLSVQAKHALHPLSQEEYAQALARNERMRID